MKRIYLLISVLFMLSITVQAQNRTVTGIVTSKDDGVPLISVTIQVKGSTIGTATDANGKYAIKVTNLQNVVIGAKYLGYDYQEVTLKPGQTNANFELVPTVNNLDEVVVVGYGTQKKIHLTGAVSTVNVKQIEDIPTTNLTAALRGTVPGISISGGTQRPGQTGAITVRNPMFLSKDGGTTEPLYVIDDIFRSSADFNLLDQSEIESVSILKDASAAIYGIQGNNGVVVVRTKRGKAGAPKLSFSTSIGSSDAIELPHMMSGLQLATYLNDYQQAKNSNTIDVNGYINGVLTNKVAAWYTPDELDYISNNNTNFLSPLFKPAIVTRQAVSVSGGNEKVTYFAGANYVNQNSNFSGVNSNRLGFRGSVDGNLTKRLKVSLSLSGDISKSKSYWYKLSGTSESLDNDVLSLITAAPWTKYFIDGNPVLMNSTAGSVDNINVALFQNSDNYTTNNSYIINALTKISYEIPGIKGLTANASYNRNINNYFGKQYGSRFLYYQYAGTGANNHIPGGALIKTVTLSNGDRVRLNPSINDNYQLNTDLTYERTFGKHYISFLALYEQSEINIEGVAAEADGVILNTKDNQNFTTGTQSSNQSTMVSSTGREAYAARLNYSYADKYLVELAFRADASVVFAPGKQWGYFPSGSVGWVASKEKIIRDNLPFINLLKFRASVGLLGNNSTKPFQYEANYSFGTASSGGAVFGELDRGIGIAPNVAMPNRNVTWDSDLKTNYGVDMQFLNNRLSFSGDYFFNHGYNLLSNVTSSVSLLIGTAIPSENYGALNMFGYEISASWRDKIGKDWSYNFSPFFTWSDNKLLKVDQPIGNVGTYLDLNGKSSDQGVLGYKCLGMFRTQADVDNWLTQYPGYTIFGNAPQPGMLIFQDVRGPKDASGNYTAPDGKVTTEDQTYLSHKASNHYGLGLNFGGAFKSLSLNVIMGMSFGGTAQIESAATKLATASSNRPEFWADHWTPTNTNAAYPSPYYTYAYDLTSDFWFKNSLTFKITSFNLSYTLPTTITSKLNVGDIRAYVTGTNPLNFYNPFSYRDNSNGYTSYPNLRTFSFGLNVSF